MSTTNSTWQRIDIPNLPTPRIGSAFVANPKKKSILLFGGNTSSHGSVNDSWSINEPNASKLSLKLLPEERSFAGFTWDEAQQKTVLFGGIGNENVLDDTWVFDGDLWVIQQPITSPSPRAYSSLFFDTIRNQTILFGGAAHKKLLNDMWAWDGTNWQQILPPNLPLARAGTSLVYDRARQSALLFGGKIEGGILDDVWLWNGTNWIEQQPPNRPSARTDFGMAYNENKQHIILFGGLSRGQPVNETWIWDGQNWMQLQPAQSPPKEVIYAPRLVYSSVLQKIVLYNAFRKKTVATDGTTEYEEHSECWALSY